MKLLHFQEEGRTKLGISTVHGVIDVGAALGANAAPELKDVDSALKAGNKALDVLRALDSRIIEEGGAAFAGAVRNEEELTLEPCVLQPGKLICVGLNYRRHAEETNSPIPTYPILFNKFENALSAHGREVTIPKTSIKTDYEAELGIVIGRTAFEVSPEEALDYVGGYCNVNDVSARDLQMRTSQWLLGKSLDGFCPIGPYLVTADAVPDPNALGIRCTVNGEVRQNSNTGDMIFDCRTIISYISHHMTLRPGDLIMTGTPEGVMMGYPEDRQKYLKHGDIVTVDIDGLGSLTNRFV
ncbi:fumarylacetoacetate hydrolase family protein [Cohnella fermenti]|uniref:Fumarylacetoacetate hydrolase family protein n=1 Tax=Cohnella fermenti TaxID=2565925 RepID=A0A4S4C8Y1_9BACL|nr:fumarylacetoacetate hydrolase family protein [Cohnella fermenti]THF84502.1 fumarylacetoacetate hydrolase family protein [Cohnella fermenti]